MKLDKIITIDGPSASGKGSVFLISKSFKFSLLDSGLLYQAYVYL